MIESTCFSCSRFSGDKTAPCGPLHAGGGLVEGHDFVWAVGIESSTLPHLEADQFEWTQHNQQWRQDLKLVRNELGIKHMRYSIPWHYVESARGRYDWSVADERIAYCHELGIELMLDVMHFGTPRWLSQAVGDPEFPEALEQWTEALVSRYRCVSAWCPVNEPLVTSLFSGDIGLWPPHSRKWRGYFPVLSRVALATSRSIRAIRRVQPEAVVLLCDAADHFKTRDASLADEVHRRNLRRFLLIDLISGRFDRHHPLYDWAHSYGLTDLDLDWLRSHPQMPDVIGLDYYAHSDWQLERSEHGLRQRRSESPAGLYKIARDYFARFGRPMMLTETSIEGKPINRQVWLERIVDDIHRLREDGVPLLGMVWWPLLDHLDWDGALTHRIGKLHQVGLYKLVRQADGRLRRVKTELAGIYSKLAAGANAAVGEMEAVVEAAAMNEQQEPPLGEAAMATIDVRPRQSLLSTEPSLAGAAAVADVQGDVGGTSGGNGGNGDRLSSSTATAMVAPSRETLRRDRPHMPRAKAVNRYGIVVFSHLRWGFVWQRPQQFLSRFARKHHILFVEEPIFDQTEGTHPRLDLHQVMPNVTVVAMHGPQSWSADPDLPAMLRQMTQEAIDIVNESGDFDRPLLWYYSPMDAAWTLGHFDNRGIIYDCMDELSQFTGAPSQLVEMEQWLMQHSDVVFAGGYSLWQRKSRQHDNSHFFGCGVEADHFAAAMDDATPVPPDIDFMNRPIIGWFGVIDERVDYHLVGEVARLRPDWSLAMIGPVVKIDPNLLPHSPNLFWMGGRDYSILPNYCKAFDVCMMCFAINEATEYINPTKALEYLATGRAVVSTPVADIVRQYSDVVSLAATPQEFVAAIEKSLQSPDRERIEKGLNMAREATWEVTVEKMQRLIAQAIRPDTRRSAARIEPRRQVQLSYKYVSTPGS